MDSWKLGLYSCFDEVLNQSASDALPAPRLQYGYSTDLPAGEQSSRSDGGPSVRQREKMLGEGVVLVNFDLCWDFLLDDKYRLSNRKQKLSILLPGSGSNLDSCIQVGELKRFSGFLASRLSERSGVSRCPVL